MFITAPFIIVINNFKPGNKSHVHQDETDKLLYNLCCGMSMKKEDTGNSMSLTWMKFTNVM